MVLSNSADLVFVNGEVLTLDHAFQIAEGLAVRAGQIAAVGTDAEVRDFIGPRTRVVDLAGRALLPGINDSHLHGCALGASLPPLEVDVSFPAVASIADVRAVLRDKARELPAGEPIVGNGWDLGYLAECKSDPDRKPTRWDLDDVTPEHPVYLQDFSRHVAWVNTAWLKRSGLSGEESAPPGGVIGHDERGMTGLFFEGAQNLVQGALPELDADRRHAAISATLAWLREMGITSYTEPGLGPGGAALMGGAMSDLTLDTYAEMARRGELTARVNVLWLPCSMTGSAADVRANVIAAHPPADVDPRLLRIIGAKIFADGIPPNKTAWMSDEYVGGGHGSLCVHGHTEAERSLELTEMIRIVHDAGLQAGVHVTGDAAIDAVVEAFVSAAREGRRWDARHYVIHGDFLSPQSMAGLAGGGFGVNMNPAIKWTISDLMDEMLGEERSSRQWPMASALAAGVRVSASSDAPVTKPDWRRGVSAMMLRESKATGRVSGETEVVGLADALRAYTSTPAWQDFSEDWKGTLQVGRAADLCVLGSGLLHADPHDIPEIPIDMTVFDGAVVHEA